jgi:hypothetical protein
MAGVIRGDRVAAAASRARKGSRNLNGEMLDLRVGNAEGSKLF